MVAAGARRIPVTATGPTGALVDAAIAAAGDTALVEMAEASGLRRLPGGRFDPLHATTYGTGELIAVALDLGVARLVLGIGGSATTDGGTGMASALGARFLDREGRPWHPVGALLALAAIEWTGSTRSAGVQVTVACDVDNLLVGQHGAAAVHAPEGRQADEVLLLDSALRRYVLHESAGLDLADVPGAGAAGGLGAGAIAFLGANLRPGIELVLELVGFHDAVAKADLVITGRDLWTRRACKAPYGVAQAAAANGVPVVAIAGIVGAAERDAAPPVSRRPTP